MRFHGIPRVSAHCRISAGAAAGEGTNGAADEGSPSRTGRIAIDGVGSGAGELEVSLGWNIGARSQLVAPVSGLPADRLTERRRRTGGGDFRLTSSPRRAAEISDETIR
jgi:hypothetical protein